MVDALIILSRWAIMITVLIGLTIKAQWYALAGFAYTFFQIEILFYACGQLRDKTRDAVIVGFTPLDPIELEEWIKKEKGELH